MQRVLSLLESDDPNERRKAFESIKCDDSALRISAAYSNYSDIRLAAVNRLSEDMESLDHIIRTGRFDDSKKAATEKLSSLMKAERGESLFNIARYSKLETARTAAVLELHGRGDHDLLGYVAVSSEFENSRQLALSFLRGKKGTL